MSGGRRKRTFALRVALAVLVVSGPAVAGAQTDPTSVRPPAEVRDDGRRTLRRLPVNLGRGIVGVVHGDNLIPFLAGATATASASYLDQNVRNGIQGIDPQNQGWGQTFETGAGPVWSTVFVAGMFTAGRLAHGPRFRAMTYDLLDATIVNLGYTELIKLVVGRERPNGQDNKSFPSGHTSNAFALAAVAERHYGWKVGVPAYLLAGAVGASRLQQDKHYLSDVVAGATLGYIVGRTVARVNGRPIGVESSQGAQVRLAPMLAHRARGLQVSVLF